MADNITVTVFAVDRTKTADQRGDFMRYAYGRGQIQGLKVQVTIQLNEGSYLELVKELAAGLRPHYSVQPEQIVAIALPEPEYPVIEDPFVRTLPTPEHDPTEKVEITPAERYQQRGMRGKAKV